MLDIGEVVWDKSMERAFVEFQIVRYSVDVNRHGFYVRLTAAICIAKYLFMTAIIIQILHPVNDHFHIWVSTVNKDFHKIFPLGPIQQFCLKPGVNIVGIQAIPIPINLLVSLINIIFLQIYCFAVRSWLFFSSN